MQFCTVLGMQQVFSCCAVCCVILLATRRKVFGGELGGPKGPAYVSSVFLAGFQSFEQNIEVMKLERIDYPKNVIQEYKCLLMGTVHWPLLLAYPGPSVGSQRVSEIGAAKKWRAVLSPKKSLHLRLAVRTNHFITSRDKTSGADSMVLVEIVFKEKILKVNHKASTKIQELFNLYEPRIRGKCKDLGALRVCDDKGVEQGSELTLGVLRDSGENSGDKNPAVRLVFQEDDWLS
eukprot:s125_g24.t1